MLIYNNLESISYSDLSLSTCLGIKRVDPVHYHSNTIFFVCEDQS